MKRFKINRRIRSPLSRAIVLAVIVISACTGFRLFGIEPSDFAVEAVAQVAETPPQIRLTWPKASFATVYAVSRKLFNDQSWSQLATLPGGSTTFTDASVVSGAAYDYEIAQSSSDNVTAYGYVYAGVAVPFTSARGRVVLVVDNTYANELSSELARLQTDLVGDGWTVVRHDASRSAPPAEIKALIRGDYNASPSDTRAVLLFGHLAVPYSGDINPDLHPTHRGAWPADVYYGDMDGHWTDGSVYDTSAEDPRNHNIPGDGKFDQSDIPARVALAVGRIDLADLPAFAPRTELELLRRYLDKNHNFRHAVFRAERRALIRDNFGEIDGDAPAADAWRTFTPFFGPTNIRAVGPGEFFPTMNAESYLWSYAAGAGRYYQADGVGSTTDFATQSPRCVFFMLDGSYFGDWDMTDNFLRAALASPGYGLAAAWTGLPHWFMHHMALGETIGVSTLVAQNNRGLYKNQVNLSAGQVHIALMGDPTLRMHVVAPPGNLSASPAGNGAITLNWSGSPDPVQGYYVYRSGSPSGPFTRLTRGFLNATAYSDLSPPSGPKSYMVRAVKLEQTASGSYYNPSQGIFATTDGGGGQLLPAVRIEAANDASESGPSPGAFAVSRTDPVGGGLSIELAIDGTAGNGEDYELISSAVLIPAGQATVQVTIRPIPDTLVEGPETVTLTLLPSAAYHPGASTTATILIQDQPLDQPPTISAIPDQQLQVNAPARAISFRVADSDTPVGSVSMSATSSNTDLLPPASLTLNGAGEDRTLTLLPARDLTGTATVTLVASDGTATSTRAFQVTVTNPGKIGSIETQPTGEVLIQFDGTSGRSYVVRESEDLAKWTVADSGVFSTNGTASYLDRTASTAPCRFYVVEWQ